MPFETIIEKISVGKNLFHSDGLFAKYAENIVRSILLKDQSLIKRFEGLETIGDRLKFLQKHAADFDFTTKVSSTDAFIERNLNKVSYVK